MGVDGVKPGAAPVTTPVAAPTPAAEPVKVEPAPVAEKKPAEGFDAPKKKLMSVSGRYAPGKPQISDREDLKDEVSAQRSLANANIAAPTHGASAEQVRKGTAVLKHGEKGSGVESVQKSLGEAGYPVNPTGVYDDETLKAVRSFQQEHGLKGNGGMVDQHTLKTLEGAGGRRDERMGELLKDKELSSSDAKKAVRLAQADAYLAPGDRSEKNVKPALVSLYTRSGMPLDEANEVAARTLTLADKGGEPIKIKNEKKPRPTTQEELDADLARLRTKTELDAAFNADRTKQWPAADIKKDPRGFVRNMVESDGNTGTEADKNSCAPNSMLAGALLKRPESGQELGEKLLSPKGQKEFPEMQKEPLRASVERMKSGNYSPADVSAVGSMMEQKLHYTSPDGREDPGVNHPRNLVLHAKLANIGWTQPESRMDVYGTPQRKGTHATAFSNGTGYDPFNYPGSHGQATVLRGEDSARAHGLAIGPRVGKADQKRVLLERTEFDGKGGMTHQVGWFGHEGKEINPPLRAKYTFDKTRQEWTRDPSVKIPAEYEKVMPARISSNFDELKTRTDIDH